MKLIYYAKNVNELLFQIKNNPGIKVIGGCTRISEQPDKAISIFGLEELSQIIRHERYIEVGPGARLSDLIQVGQTHLPQIVHEALTTIANPIIRNTATIGGNICEQNHLLTLYAPLLALDTKLEFMNQTETISESLINFQDIPEGHILSNIKIPLVDADISIFRRLGPAHFISQQSASFAFLASTEKNSLINVRLAFAGPFIFRSKELENNLVGRHLPLSQKDITQIQEMVREEFQKASANQMISDVMTQQFLNLTRYSFEQLT